MGALSVAWARVKSRPRLIVGLALINLLLTFAATRPFSAALANLIDIRPGASAMVRGNDGLLAELLTDHPEAIAAAMGGAQAVLVLWGLLAWILAGGILSTLALPAVVPARGSLRDLLAESAQHAWRMTKLGALGLTARIVPFLLGAAVWFSLKPIFAHRGFSQLATWAFLTALVFALSWAWATVAVDYARALALTEPIKVHRAFGRGIKRSLRAPTVTIVLFSLVGFAAITLVQAALAHALPAEPAWAAFVAFLLRVAAALGRTAVATTTLVAAGIATRA
jgi:hypothetical protein